ncbi:MAG TPA: hypothetical protein PLA50_03740, partial [Bacteroidia bacterium]|nr:hypothetical protein [Bacteroidia bacterium]
MSSTEILPQTAPLDAALPSSLPPLELAVLPSQTPFPRNLFQFRTYGALKLIALFFLAWAMLNFGRTLYLATFDRSYFTERASEVIENRGIVKKAAYWLKGVFWQDVPKA